MVEMAGRRGVVVKVAFLPFRILNSLHLAVHFQRL